MRTKEINDELQSTLFKQKKLIATRIDNELLLFEVETSIAHCLNDIASEMWVACEQQSSAVEVTEFLRTRRPDMEKEVVWASLSKMAAAGLLEETTNQEDIAISRRELIRKLGITAALVLPIVVTSVLVPPPAAAASCGTLGMLCGGGRAPCCSGLICVAGICV
jgi:hypothetical protein